jgi:hypothetical protein
MNFILVDRSPAPTATPAAGAASMADSVAAGIARLSTRARPASDRSDARPGGERRWSGRRRAATPAYIAHGKSPEAIVCILRDTSCSGAQIELALPATKGAPQAWSSEIPDRLTLLLHLERMQVDCCVMWRAGKRLGVRYISPFRPMAKAPAPKAAPKKR